MKLLIQPDDGVFPLVDAINKARSRIEIVIFRFDREELERALAAAVKRGVFVHALIAYANRGGEKKLRKLEMRLLAAGITVARTSDDLARYHGKFLIVDRRELHLLAFNFTHLDIDHSRSFGLVARNAPLVQEAIRLFEADMMRQPFTASLPGLVVSPVNARKQLAALIRGARKELLIYDPEVSDPLMVRLLEERANAGVNVRIIGRLTRKSTKLEQRKLSRLRLHARCIIRDGHQAFLGSQSLREVELGARREVGLIFRDSATVGRLFRTFHQDWEAAGSSQETGRQGDAPAAQVAKKVAKAVTRDLPPIAPVVEVMVKKVVGSTIGVNLDPHVVEDNVKGAVREAVKDVVMNVVGDVVPPDENIRSK